MTILDALAKTGVAFVALKDNIRVEGARRASGAHGFSAGREPYPGRDRCADRHVADERSERPPDTVADGWEPQARSTVTMSSVRS